MKRPNTVKDVQQNPVREKNSIFARWTLWVNYLITIDGSEGLTERCRCECHYSNKGIQQINESAQKSNVNMANITRLLLKQSAALI